MSADTFIVELKQFIDANKGKYITNDDIDIKYYDKILQRLYENKQTNVKSITNVYKLIQYYLAAKMLRDNTTKRLINDYVYDNLGYEYSRDFEQLFVNVEIEFPDYKILDGSKVSVVGNSLVYKDNDKEITIIDTEIKHNLINSHLNLDSNAWKNVENSIIAPIGSIQISVPWKFKGKIKLNKNTGEYCVAEGSLYANYPISGKNLICRYSGLNNSAWINIYSFDSDTIENIQNRDWNGDEIRRGNIYIAQGYNILASIKGDWDGYYNNISFDKLKELLERLV